MENQEGLSKIVEKIRGLNFTSFRDFLGEKLAKGITESKKKALKDLTSETLYAAPESLGLSKAGLAGYLAEFCGIPFRSFINPEEIASDELPAAFSKANSVVILHQPDGKVLVMCNPFKREALDLVCAKFDKNGKVKWEISDPDALNLVLMEDPAIEIMTPGTHRDYAISDNMQMLTSDQKETEAIVRIADYLLSAAILNRASDIHIEPKEAHYVVRFRVDGQLQDVYGLKPKTGLQLVTRYKVFGSLDIAEKRKPQDGAIEVKIMNRVFKLRIATTPTAYGESMILRLLDQTSRAKSLVELGMSTEHSEKIIQIAGRERGLILVVGPTGSGKTTTLYSLLTAIHSKTTSLISVEDPIENKIPSANQQQVNEKAGATFEALLKSSVRQDPDILFLGEIRDSFSAKMALDFASTGHLTFSTLHTSNATTALFRLERLGVPRGAMADSILAIIAQRLLRKLCDHCKKIEAPTETEINQLKGFLEDVLAKVARPQGCPRCNQCGYWGREAVVEIIEFDPEIAAMIRANKSIAEVRSAIFQRGFKLMSHHAASKVTDLKCSVQDVYENILIEEAANESGPVSKENMAAIQNNKASKNVNEKGAPLILIVDDDEHARALLARILENQGYQVAFATDGAEGLISLGRANYDLIISDVNMPNLDGFKLLELAKQKGVECPILFLTARQDSQDEAPGLELGAADYIRKPIDKDVLLKRLENILKNKK